MKYTNFEFSLIFRENFAKLNNLPFKIFWTNIIYLWYVIIRTLFRCIKELLHSFIHRNNVSNCHWCEQQLLLALTVNNFRKFREANLWSNQIEEEKTPRKKEKTSKCNYYTNPNNTSSFSFLLIRSKTFVIFNVLSDQFILHGYSIYFYQLKL